MGKPVIEINVDDDQLEDRIDEAIQYFQQFHSDGIRRTYLKYKLTADDKTRLSGLNQESESKTDLKDSSVSTTWYEDKNYLVVPETVLSVINIFPFSNKGTMNLFDVRYQMRLNDLYDFSSTSMVNYEVVLRHLDFLDHILVGEKPIRFNQHDNRLHIDMDWKNDLQVGEYLVIECYRKLDPNTFTDVYDDMWLKKYATALTKYQWGENLSKFSGIQLPGGVELDGSQMKQEAQEEILRLEEEARLNHDMLPLDMIG